VDVVGRWIPLGFVYLAGAARMAGLEGEIYDALAKGDGFSEIEKRFRRSDASYIASTAITSSVNVAVKTLELAKRCNPQVVTILGGLHPTFCCEEVLSTTAAVDYIVCGEGEVTIRELLVALEEGGDPARIPGLAFRRDGQVVITPSRSCMGSIDDLPAAWDLLDWQVYKYLVIPDSRLGAVSTSRACDHGGSPCPRPGIREKNRRYRDPQRVADEIVHLYETYGVNVILIADEYPTNDHERWEQFLDLLIERSLPVYLLMQAPSSDIVRDRDILWKYRKAGVVHIYVEIQADDQAADTEPDGAEGKLALDIIHEYGIVTETSFVLGAPDETRKHIERILDRARYYNPDNIQFLAFTPWPYADMYEEVKQYIKVHDYTKYNLIEPIIEPKKMSLLQVDVAMVDCYRRFYMGKMKDVMTMRDEFKRNYLMQAMRLIMGSSFLLKKLCVGTLGKIPAKLEELMDGLDR
jgi:anaerobic magnesium-protoporphyrin IX monomethyl ester cyclase